MDMHYSAATGGFYLPGFHVDIPADAVAITADRHRDLLAGQAAGHRIVAGADGHPSLAIPDRPTLADRRVAMIAAVKDQAQDRILATASLIQQANDNAAIAMAALAATAGTDGDPAANVTANAAIDRRRRIDAIRAASNILEATIATLSSRRLDALDITAGHHWPA